MKKDMIIHEAPKSPVSEAVRTLRTNLTYKMNKTGEKVFLITSSSSGEGKSWTSSNLAISFVQSKQKVLLIDADLRKGRQHQVFSLDNSIGLSNILDNRKICKDSVYLDEEVDKLIQKTEIDNLYVIPSGMVPHNPSELLESEQFSVVLENLRNKFDVIFVDAPPANIVTDSIVLCTKVDGVILACAMGKAKREALLDTKEKILNVGGNILGVVINKMPTDKMKEYTKDYSRYTEGQIIKYTKNNFNPYKEGYRRSGQ